MKIQPLELLSIAFYRSSTLFLDLLLSSLSLRKNPTHRNLTLEKHFMKSFKYEKDKLYIENFQKTFSNAFNTIMQLFFTIVYIRITTLTRISHDHPLVEFPLS